MRRREFIKNAPVEFPLKNRSHPLSLGLLTESMLSVRFANCGDSKVVYNRVIIVNR